MKKLFLLSLVFLSVVCNAQYLKFEQISMPTIDVRHNFQHVNGKTLFVVDNPAPGQYKRLWSTDGTLTGTNMINTTQYLEIPDGFIDTITSGVLNGEVFFTGFDSTNGAALWKTDGTSNGTVFVKDINQLNSISGGSFFFTEVSNKLVFQSFDTLYGRELYVTDGTNAGTFLLKDINPSGSSDPENFVRFNNKVYFSATNANNKKEIWVTDGTIAGTQMFINPSAHFNIPNLSFAGSTGYAFNNELYFVSNNYLFCTDGTLANTKLLSDTVGSLMPERIIDLETMGYVSKYFLPMGGKLYFQAEDVSNKGAELWVTDGTKIGTHKVKEITPGNTGRVQKPMAVLNDAKIIFSTSEYIKNDPNDTGLELWVTDGTSQGTVFLKETDTSSLSLSYPAPSASTLVANHFIEYHGNLYFRALNNSLNEFYLWRTDGTPQGTYPVIDTPLNIESDAVLFNDRMYWKDQKENSNYFRGVLWQSEGDSNTTSAIRPIGDTNSLVRLDMFFNQYAIIGNSLIFSATYGDPNLELWSLTTYPVKVISYQKDNFEFTLYPNPTNNILKIATDETIEDIELYDMNGRRLRSLQGNQEVDVSQLNNGLYILKVQTKKGVGSSTFEVAR